MGIPARRWLSVTERVLIPSFLLDGPLLLRQDEVAWPFLLSSLSQGQVPPRHSQASAAAGVSCYLLVRSSLSRQREMHQNRHWGRDALPRCLTIANGEGTVHGNHYDLEAQYGITLNSAFR